MKNRSNMEVTICNMYIVYIYIYIYIICIHCSILTNYVRLNAAPLSILLVQWPHKALQLNGSKVVSLCGSWALEETCALSVFRVTASTDVTAGRAALLQHQCCESSLLAVEWLPMFMPPVLCCTSEGNGFAFCADYHGTACGQAAVVSAP